MVNMPGCRVVQGVCKLPHVRDKGKVCTNPAPPYTATNRRWSQRYRTAHGVAFRPPHSAPHQRADAGAVSEVAGW